MGDRGPTIFQAQCKQCGGQPKTLSPGETGSAHSWPWPDLMGHPSHSPGLRLRLCTPIFPFPPSPSSPIPGSARAQLQRAAGGEGPTSLACSRPPLRFVKEPSRQELQRRKKGVKWGPLADDCAMWTFAQRLLGVVVPPRIVSCVAD